MVSCLVLNHIILLLYMVLAVCVTVCLGTYVWGGLYHSGTPSQGPDRSLNMYLTDYTALFACAAHLG